MTRLLWLICLACLPLAGVPPPGSESLPMLRQAQKLEHSGRFVNVQIRLDEVKQERLAEQALQQRFTFMDDAPTCCYANASPSLPPEIEEGKSGRNTERERRA